MLDGKIKLPGAGEVSKKAAAGGAFVVIGVLTIAYIRHARNASTTNANAAGGTAASATDNGTLVTDPAGNQCAAVNPDSGYCPGTEQDIAFSSQAGDDSDAYSEYGAGGDDSGADYGIGGSAGYNPDTGLYTDPNGVTCETPLASGYCPSTLGGTSPVSGTGTCPLGYTYSATQTGADGEIQATNGTGWCEPSSSPIGQVPETKEQWIAQTAKDLPGSAATFEIAAAKVFAGITVTTAQKQLFLEGVGVNPLPPGVTYPPIKTSDTSAQPGTTKVKVPTLTGKRGEEARVIVEGLGFKYTQSPATTGKGKTTTVTSQSPGPGTSANKGSTVHVNLRVS
jgi:PASTA domain